MIMTLFGSTSFWAFCFQIVGHILAAQHTALQQQFLPILLNASDSCLDLLQRILTLILLLHCTEICISSLIPSNVPPTAGGTVQDGSKSFTTRLHLMQSKRFLETMDAHVAKDIDSTYIHEKTLPFSSYQHDRY